MRAYSDESKFRVVEQTMRNELAHTVRSQLVNHVLEKLSANAPVPVIGPHFNGKFCGGAHLIEKCVRSSNCLAVFDC